MDGFADSEVIETWSSPLADGVTMEKTQRYGSTYRGPDGEGYLVYETLFRPPENTVDFSLHFELVVRGARPDFWAAYEAYLEIEGEGRKVLAKGSKETNTGVADNVVRFALTRDRFNDYYNGKRLRFIVRHQNNAATVTRFQMWVDRTY